VKERAKPKIIRRYTNVAQRTVAELYMAARAEMPPPGPLGRGSAVFYTSARDSKEMAGPQWNLQGTIFLHNYVQLMQRMPFPVNRGWALLQAYRGYLRMTARAHEAAPTRKLDINSAYALLVLSGLPNAPELGEVRLHRCDVCGRDYLVATDRELSAQRCPLHQMSDKALRIKRLPLAEKVA
jgi:hypothetical protein